MSLRVLRKNIRNLRDQLRAYAVMLENIDKELKYVETEIHQIRRQLDTGPDE